MQDQGKMRDARMMAAVAGLGGRNALSSEVDLRLGLAPSPWAASGWLKGLTKRLRRQPDPRRDDARIPRHDALPDGTTV